MQRFCDLTCAHDMLEMLFMATSLSLQPLGPLCTLANATVPCGGVMA